MKTCSKCVNREDTKWVGISFTLSLAVLFENGFLAEKRPVDVNSENMWEGSAAVDPVDINSCCRFGLPTLPFYDPQNPNASIYIKRA